jgi:hypothetical protein
MDNFASAAPVPLTSVKFEAPAASAGDATRTARNATLFMRQG